MNRVLLDVNVILDVLLDRAPHAAASAAVWKAAETGSAEGLLAAHAVTTIYDLVSKARDSAQARRTIAKLLQVFRVAPVDHGVLERALTLRGADFEDCVTAAAADSAGCHWIVTRDPKGFRHSGVRALTPEVAAQLIDRAEQ